jgi:prepilin-type N-terminal cleavage/methylation domain-containing protein
MAWYPFPDPAMKSQSDFMKGFTLIELLLVIIILGFMVGMLVPAAGSLDNKAKNKENRAVFEEVRAAILGPRNAFDANGNRVIGGYVGDTGYLPALYRYDWDSTNKKWEHLDTTPVDNYPDVTANNDLFTPAAGDENAQPAALWKKRLPGHSGVTIVSQGWKGPYLAEPADRYPEDQVWGYGTDDEKRRFHLLETEGRLSDGWGRAFLIYVDDEDEDGDITNDMTTDLSALYPGLGLSGVSVPCNLVFVSAGPDGFYAEADPANTDPTAVELAANPELESNRDNLVFRIARKEWDDAEEKRRITSGTLEEIRKALLGHAPHGVNTEFTGTVGRWPKLFRWDDFHGSGAWDDENASGVTFIKGQPRELWTKAPNDTSQTWGDPVEEPSWQDAGIGWRHAYLSAPWGTGEEEVLEDAWGREILIFRDTSNDALLILSRGPDGRFAFGHTDAHNTEPVDFTESSDPTVDITQYDADAPWNQDNLVVTVTRSDWDSGAFRVNRFTVYGAVENAGGPTTKAALFYASGASEIKTAGDDGACTSGVTWTVGSGATLAFNRMDMVQGPRHLVFWDDTDNDGVIDTGSAGENQYTYVVNIASGLEEVDDIVTAVSEFVEAK